ncbi:NAM domain-containing protein, partial [Cephalotus follicularis]
MNRKVGHRFHPTDEEIINHFLRKKALGLGHEVSDDIAEVDVCKFEPWQLPDLAVNTSDYDLEWFFFCPCNYKYTNSRRANRTTKSGYWKVTGKDRKLWIIKGAKHQIGIKKTLVFHRGRVPNGIRTNWVIHEYHPTAFNFQNQRAYVICRLKQKADVKVEKSTADEGELCLQRPSDYRNILENAFPDGNPLVRTLTQNGWLDYDSSVEQGLDLQFSNGFCNDLNGLQYYDCSEHENEDFLNSLIVDPFEETVHTHHNGSRPSESLKVYVEGSRD